MCVREFQVESTGGLNVIDESNRVVSEDDLIVELNKNVAKNNEGG